MRVQTADGGPVTWSHPRRVSAYIAALIGTLTHGDEGGVMPDDRCIEHLLGVLVNGTGAFVQQ